MNQSYQTLRSGAARVALGVRGTVAFAGADRATFLQGLLTNDIGALEAGSGCYAAYLTPQGRMIADMRLLELGDRLLMDVDRQLADSLVSRFSMLVFSEVVEVADESAAWHRVGVRGPGSATRVGEALDPPGDVADSTPNGLTAYRDLDNGWWALDGVPVLAASNDELGVPGIDLWVASTHGVRLDGRLAEVGLEPADADAVEALRVEAGTPRFGTDMDGETIPLEAGISARAISETKGCYVGQEVIIRILHRGQGRVARRLVGLAFAPELDAAPVAGVEVHGNGEPVGHVTSVAWSPRLARPIALAYVRREHAAPGTSVEVASGTTRVEAAVTALPFPP
ncbi:MAG: glycine cleavage T C-terminal barrel domain-containing protein [Vicinamibacterales bacterium]|nr:glycine cleavage T C-terminal barrel domain-containing protein [Vicinamibacterales bacterium]MDP7471226.1 glycine cleavage T C-terminal barrel domain-containing protein [Vicinamibacterales bacterium]HJO36979.1 glycine cleavage T C-terminal barrel domain-containing protein [Vicinamibacterales bacterium]